MPTTFGCLRKRTISATGNIQFLMRIVRMRADGAKHILMCLSNVATICSNLRTREEIDSISRRQPCLARASTCGRFSCRPS